MYIYVHAGFENSMRAKVIECARAARPQWVGRSGYRGDRGAGYGNGGAPSCHRMSSQWRCTLMSWHAYPPAPCTLPLPLQSTKAVGTAQVERAQSRAEGADKGTTSLWTRLLFRQAHDMYCDTKHITPMRHEAHDSYGDTTRQEQHTSQQHHTESLDQADISSTCPHSATRCLKTPTHSNTRAQGSEERRRDQGCAQES